MPEPSAEKAVGTRGSGTCDSPLMSTKSSKGSGADGAGSGLAVSASHNAETAPTTCPGCQRQPCVCTTVSLPPTRTAENAELDDDLPTAQSYVIEYAWACDCCNEVNGTEDIDTSGSVQICDFCGQRTRVTT